MWEVLVNNIKVIPEYLFFYTKSQFFKAWIRENQRISAQPNINGTEYLDADIILPPMNIQKKIVDECLKKLKLETEKKELASIVLAESISNFEKEIFR